ncbi:hypothetical protein PSTG_12352 [Puccinia striiformis f. sp. tritici PST-78]|uniref:CxC5 like cysteine cluster associated with KDZ domain-containing protein n=1 Tax=Puccinia striiformis f. sp. tritici PST-78 TaxID=1165861 RepID=A0A0L0V4W8_9BASI|nr:hypothetical protein PSTG_12352 [Puccinia striiformis f. sp. tritici PST-78]
MLLRELISILDAHDVNIMLTITVQDFAKFLCVAAGMAMRSEKSLRLTTLRRPIRYLAASLSPPIHQYLEVFWDASFNILKDCYINAQHHVKTHGIMTELDDGRLPIRIVDQSLFPPVEHCTKCSRTMRSSSLFGYLYDVDGCHTIEHFSLYCQPCLTNYYVSYSIYNKQRMFYTSSQGRDPKVFQVHTHYFMTHRLAHHFKMSQMLQQCSVFSIINLYNSTFMGARAPPLFTPLQSFFPQLSVEVCKDEMDIDTLIYNYSLRSQVLVVPAAGLDRVRYNEAKKQCSSWIAAEGTAHKNHSCGLCTCITYSEDNGSHSVVRAVVTDGLTIGHWRCSASASQLEMLAKEFSHPAPDGPCWRTLYTVRNQYCSFHQPFLEGICQAQPCTQPALENQKTCGLQSHLDAAKTFATRVNSNFQLHSMLNRPGSHLNLDLSVHLEDESGEVEDWESLQQADELDRAEESIRSGEERPSKKPTLARARTHNDQLAVAPCGVILARQTMFNSESPSAVKVTLSCV